MIELVQAYGPIPVALTILAAAVFLLVKQKRNGNGQYAGPDRRRPDDDALEFRREMRESHARLHEGVTEIKGDVRLLRYRVDRLEDLRPR